MNAYSDDAPQFETAMNELRIPLDQSLPGRPQNNSLAERNNQFLLLTTITCLLQAGLPPCFWPFAVHLLNVEKNVEDKQEHGNAIVHFNGDVNPSRLESSRYC